MSLGTYRLWPGVVFATLAVALRFGLSLISQDAMYAGVIGGLACSVVVALWWLFFSRTPIKERWLVFLALVLFVGATRGFLLHPSLATGMMGFLFFIYALPFYAAALVFWAVISRGRSTAGRIASLTAILCLVSGVFACLRTGGVDGAGRSDFAWRWQPDAEERLLTGVPSIPAPAPEAQQSNNPPTAKPAEEASSSPVPEEPPSRDDWPGFRGTRRDSAVPGLRIETDWTASPPTQLWRRPVGPGWSSFAVRKGLVYTQEQRGGHELVSCYRLESGSPVWSHQDTTRFWESNAGAGPRGTPTLSGNRVYALGATGILNALDATTGRRLWSRNVASEYRVKTPEWGFSGSPLVVNGAVIVAASGMLASFDASTGARRWLLDHGSSSYSSPHLISIEGVPQLLLLRGQGVTAVDPSSGEPLWTHEWPGGAIVQPALSPAGGVLIAVTGASGGLGTRLLSLARAASGWTATEQWTSQGLKPYFNDFVVHRDHAYGFDGGILSCIELRDGARKWKGGRYGHGQMLLLPEQDLLLVLSEEGEIALVSATPERFQEITRRPAISGKTWNHPAISGSTLLVRNGEEMAAFRLPPGGS